jgi:hypothetical protein
MADHGPHGLDILAVWNDVDPTHEMEYHRWYWEQHLPERLSVPGFLSAYRYQAVAGSPKFFTWYLVRDVEVLRSPRYLERLANPTEWTQRVMPWFRNMTRCACRLTVDVGRGIGGAITAARISGIDEGTRIDLIGTLRKATTQFVVVVVEETGVTRAQVWETDREVSAQRTPEQALRGGADRLIDCAIVLHCPSIELAQAAASRLRAAISPLLGSAVLEGPQAYALLHSLSVAG